MEEPESFEEQITDNLSEGEVLRITEGMSAPITKESHMKSFETLQKNRQIRRGRMKDLDPVTIDWMALLLIEKKYQRLHWRTAYVLDMAIKEEKTLTSDWQIIQSMTATEIKALKKVFKQSGKTYMQLKDNWGYVRIPIFQRWERKLKAYFARNYFAREHSKKNPLVHVSYTKYPLLLLFSVDEKNAFDQFPCLMPTPAANSFFENYLSKSVFFSLIYYSNSLSLDINHTNYYITASAVPKLSSNTPTKNSLFSMFIQYLPKPCTGSILLKDGGHYVYALLGQAETKRIKNLEGQYLATVFFMENVFYSFEEALITSDGVRIIETGYYHEHVRSGIPVWFVVSFLSYINKNIHFELLAPAANSTTETIYYLD